MSSNDKIHAARTVGKLPAGTALGRVFLRVRDLETTVGFYEQTLGLQLLRSSAGTATLGVVADDGSYTGLVVLIESPKAAAAPRNPGLYHLAILLPDRAALGDFLTHVVRTRAPLQGASDHGVSEALYLSDPEGNGVEVYRDRPRPEWPKSELGVSMTTQALDGEGVLNSANGDSEPFLAPASTTIGHLHFRVSDVARAQRFHQNVIGFEVTEEGFPGARFLAAGGYHHHIGVNSWGSAGQPPAPSGAAGLAWYELTLPDADSRAALEVRLEEGANSVEESGVPGFEARLYRDEDGIAVTVAQR